MARTLSSTATPIAINPSFEVAAVDGKPHPLTELDEVRLKEALALAEASFGKTEPNPRVGCVLGFPDGRVIGRGATQEVGGPHAEAMALREAQALGHTTDGATAWVTLEPCSHHGRTPPCCEALIAAGLSRVVVAVTDPFPQVNGAGLRWLREAGIEVALASGDLANKARDINIGFFSRHERGTPWVRMKLAASIDGVTALANGQSQWITGEAARRDGHAWRRRASAVLTGIGTALADDPRLDVRAVSTSAQPMRVVVDSQLRLPASARLLEPPGKVLIFAARSTSELDRELLSRGALVLQATGVDGQVDLKAMLRELAQQGCNEVHVEAGAVLNGALLHAGVVDELLIYLAPSLLGHGRPMAHLPALMSLAGRLKLRFEDVQLLGDDLRVRARILRHDAS
jgi:diaminohydroxyphosphoribosylaminopyrimidine deaminase/5-amino-6-(5-phosphoribosylamino)uracil reductase